MAAIQHHEIPKSEHNRSNNSSDNNNNHKRKNPATNDEDENRLRKPKATSKPKKIFIYGNYHTYYGYRIDKKADEDPRFAVFRKEWFEDKDVLDIGCNEGLVTIGIAKRFLCRHICGIDIDKGLVEAANWNLRKIIRSECNSSKLVNCSRVQDSKIKNSSKDDVSSISDSKEIRPVVSSLQRDLSKIVSFEHGNFVESLDVCSGKYDTILCLSVTKWIHLNWGDGGLINLFVKIWRLLRPGGMLILEPQPWTSYRKSRISEILTANFRELCFRPHHFREILLDKVGFKSVEIISDGLSCAALGFDRPIAVYFK